MSKHVLLPCIQSDQFTKTTKKYLKLNVDRSWFSIYCLWNRQRTSLLTKSDSFSDLICNSWARTEYDKKNIQESPLAYVARGSTGLGNNYHSPALQGKQQQSHLEKWLFDTIFFLFLTFIHKNKLWTKNSVKCGLHLCAI